MPGVGVGALNAAGLSGRRYTVSFVLLTSAHLLATPISKLYSPTKICLSSLVIVIFKQESISHTCRIPLIFMPAAPETRNTNKMSTCSIYIRGIIPSRSQILILQDYLALPFGGYFKRETRHTLHSIAAVRFRVFNPLLGSFFKYLSP